MAGKRSRTLKTFSRPEFEDRYKSLSDKDWRDLEKLWNASLPVDAREKIEVASRVYAMVGPPQKLNTVTVVRAEKALHDWIKACGRLRLALGERKTSAPLLTKLDVVTRFYGEAAVRKIGKMKPLSFVLYLVEAAMGAALFAMAEKQHQNISSALQKDLWRAWAAYVAAVAEAAGVRVSAASSNELNKESPFVKGVMFLQERLPRECRRFIGYSSVAKGVQQSRAFQQKSPESLLLILAGWGTGIPELGEYDFADAEAITGSLLHGKYTQEKGTSTSRRS
jgi:hypothetical protein